MEFSSLFVVHYIEKISNIFDIDFCLFVLNFAFWAEIFQQNSWICGYVGALGVYRWNPQITSSKALTHIVW
jgi:hypothetical protein